MKYHEEAIRILKLPEYIDPRGGIEEPIILPPVTTYEIPVP